MAESTADVAQAILDVIPLVMRAIRQEMRRHRTPALSVPQFRALAYVRRHPGASLSAAAEHIGLTLPSVSTLIDGLVAQGLLARTPSPVDRRRITLALTARGAEVLATARRGAQAGLAARVAALPPIDRARVHRGLEALRRVFEAEEEPRAGAAWKS